MSTLRTRYGIPGLISTIALVFAMTGGAFAAKYLITSPKQIKPSVLKKLKGKAGPAGPAGAQGPAGANGANGEKGANGTNGAPGEKGEKGANGTNGTNGKSVKVTEADPEFDCEERGGVIVEEEGVAASAKEVCNGEEGKDGEKGEKGEPWTPNNTLPSGATLTGGWAFSASDAEKVILVPISFPIPLTNPILVEKVHYQGEAKAEFTDVCGSFASGYGNPKADPGHLCVYFNASGSKPENATFKLITPPGKLEEELFEEEEAAGRTGAVLRFTFSGAPGTIAKGGGTFAVTAP